MFPTVLQGNAKVSTPTLGTFVFLSDKKETVLLLWLSVSQLHIVFNLAMPCLLKQKSNTYNMGNTKHTLTVLNRATFPPGSETCIQATTFNVKSM